MDYPLFEMVLNEEKELAGVLAVSLVDEPAIEKNFIALAKIMHLAKHDDEKRIITGLVMIPDTPIFRMRKTKDGTQEKFYIQFSSDTIRKASERFMTNSNMNAVTIMHEEQTFNAVITESWIVEDSEKDKLRALGLDAPQGAWAMSMKINDDTLWDVVKNTDLLNGFSVEGYFDIVKVNTDNFSIMNEEQIAELVNQVTQGVTKAITDILKPTEAKEDPKESDEYKELESEKNEADKAKETAETERDEMKSQLEKAEQERDDFKAQVEDFEEKHGSIADFSRTKGKEDEVDEYEKFSKSIKK